MSDLSLRCAARHYVTEPTDENAHRLAQEYLRESPREKTQEILVSYGFGAGWSTWENCPIAKRIMLTHSGIIKALSRPDESVVVITEDNACVQAMLQEIEDAGGDRPYLGGLGGLAVKTVTGPFLIEEYDGCETVRTLTDLNTDSLPNRLNAPWQRAIHKHFGRYKQES